MPISFPDSLTSRTFPTKSSFRNLQKLFFYTRTFLEFIFAQHFFKYVDEIIAKKWLKNSEKYMNVFDVLHKTSF